MLRCKHCNEIIVDDIKALLAHLQQDHPDIYNKVINCDVDIMDECYEEMTA